MTAHVSALQLTTRGPGDYLKVCSEHVESVAVVHFDGDVDAFTGTTMCTALAVELDREPAGLVVDLSAVGFFGCAGLSVLVDTDDRSRRSGVQMCVVSTRRSVLRPLFISGLRDRLRVRPSLPRALHDFRCSA
jgi:anti-sigma B factor antagonist